MADDYLQQAVALAARGLYTTSPNPRVGCLVVRDGHVIAQAWHDRAGAGHAEVNALAMLTPQQAAGSDVYVSLEPCAHQARTPACTEALIAAAPARVIVATLDPNPRVNGRGVERLRQAGIPVVVDEGRAHHEAKQLNIGYFSRMIRQRPWLRLKIAATLDGRTALHNGHSRWITGQQARRDAHHLRARSCAVMTGVGTVLQDDPLLNVRHVATPRQPYRVLVDSTLRTPLTMQLFASVKTLWVASAVPAPAAFPAPVLTLPEETGSKVDLLRLLTALAEREINEVTVEAGQTLNGALLSAGLVDEVVVYLAPRVFGHTGKGMFALPASDFVHNTHALQGVEVTTLGEEVKITYRAELTWL